MNFSFVETLIENFKKECEKKWVNNKIPIYLFDAQNKIYGKIIKGKIAPLDETDDVKNKRIGILD